jgi:hypothetical protein
MRGVLIVGVIAVGIMFRPAFGQSVVDQASFRSMSLGGIHLYGVSVFSGYSTSAYPVGLGNTPLGAGQLGGDTSFGGSASLGWQYHRQRWNFSMMYSGTYGGMVRYSDANAFSQNLSLSASRMLSPKWTLTFSGVSSDNTTVEFLYQPSSIGVVSQVPATMDDLAAAFSLGQFSGSQIASTLTGAPLLESPARSLLLGDRILSYSGQMGLNYAHSSRLSFHLASFAAGGQHRLNSSSVPEPNYLIPRTLGINAGMGMAYMLSPRTQVGLDVSGNRIDNRFQAGYVTNANASLGRKMGTHWFLTVHAGGSINQVTSAYGNPKTKQIIGGGSIGFRTYQHTLVGSYERASADNYGLAVGSTTTLTAAWNWRRPGSRWNVFTSFGQQQVRDTGFASFSGWQASGGIAQSLNSQMRMTAQYVYLSNSGEYLGYVSNLAVHSVRVSLSWAPQAWPAH